MKITFAVPNSGCAYWRAKQPCRMIEKLGLAECKIFGDNMTEEKMNDYLVWSDVIMMQSAMGIPVLVSMRKMKQLGKTVIGDYDDLSFALSPFNPSYKTMGLNEVKITKEGKEGYLYKDGENGFCIKANYFRYKSLQDILKELDSITTASRVIKEKYLEYNPNIFVLPNSIDFNLFKSFPRKQHKEIRIGWTASDSHYVEIWMMKRIMRKVFDKYGRDVRFVMLGNLVEMSQEFEKDSYERHDFIGLDTYPLKLAALDLDIGLCPLDDTEFNRAKSQLKWSEYSALKVPSVCTNLPPYEMVEHGNTGLLAKTEDEFFEQICTLIENTKLRNEIAQNAYDKNFQDYNLEKNAILWVEAYEQARENCKPQSLVREASESDIQKTYSLSDTKSSPQTSEMTCASM